MELNCLLCGMEIPAPREGWEKYMEDGGGDFDCPDCGGGVLARWVTELLQIESDMLSGSELKLKPEEKKA